MTSYVWLVARMSEQEFGWLPDMLMQQVEQQNSAAESAAAVQGDPPRPENRVTWQANMGVRTITLRCADRDRLLKLAEWLLVVSDTADALLMTSPTAPQLPTATLTTGSVPRLVFSFKSIGDFDRAVEAMWRHFKVHGAGPVRHEADTKGRFLALSAPDPADLEAVKGAITAACPKVNLRAYP